MLAWTGGIIGGVLLLLIVAGFALLHSSRFHAYLLRTVQSKASQALGSAVRVRETPHSEEAQEGGHQEFGHLFIESSGHLSRKLVSDKWSMTK